MVVYKTSNPLLHYHPSVVDEIELPFEFYTDSDSDYSYDEALEEIEIINHIVKHGAILALRVKWEPSHWMPLNPRLAVIEIPSKEKTIHSALRSACQYAFRYEPKWHFKQPATERAIVERIWDANGECELELSVRTETNPYARRTSYYSLPMRIDGKFTTLAWMMKNVVKQAMLRENLPCVGGRLAAQLDP